MLDADDVCQYFTRLGGGGGGGGGEASGWLRVRNRSAVPYACEWRARAWRRCACALERTAPRDVTCGGGGGEREGEAARLSVEPRGGVLAPRGETQVRVTAPLQTHPGRGVLMCVLLAASAISTR